jgi:hypothetical protein
VAPALPSPLVHGCRGSGLAAGAAVYVPPGVTSSEATQRPVGTWDTATSFDVGPVAAEMQHFGARMEWAQMWPKRWQYGLRLFEQVERVKIPGLRVLTTVGYNAV